jgi:O-antigen/teichoic acid export membrane protein
MSITQPYTDPRRRQIVRTAMTGVLAKASAFLPTLGIAPIAAMTLGPERLGVLMTVLSLLAFLQLADLGVGGNLVTGVSRAVGAGKQRRVRLLQWNGLALVSAMAVAMGFAAAGLSFSRVGALIFPQSEIALQREATLSLVVFVALFALGMPLTLMTKVQLGMQRGHVANLWQSGAALINFAAGACICVMGGPVPATIAGLMAGTLLCGVGNAVVHVLQHPEARFRKRTLRRSIVRRLFSGSLSYLALQIIFLVTYAVDTLIVARHLGAIDASGYAIAERMFSIIAVAVGVVTAPLWAAYGEALGKRDHEWARRCLRKSLWRFGLLSSLMCGSVVAAFGPLVSLLGAGTVHVPLTVAIAMAAWRVVESMGSALAVYLFASEKVQFVLWCGFATGAVSLLAKFQLVGRFGPVALPLTTLACYTCLCLIPLLLHVRHANHSSALTMERY